MMPDTGGVNEETFLTSFENLPRIDVYSFRDVTSKLKECYKMIENKDGDWRKRVNSLMEIRSLIMASLNFEEFHSKLKQLLPPFDKPLKDLRSSVVREACITVAFLSKNLGIKLDYFAESVLQDLFKLIQSSTKVMATSAIVCIRFILQYTHSPRLISRISEPIFNHNSKLNKSNEIRRACCEFIYSILQTWPANLIERNQTAFSNLQQAIKKGLEDADGVARVHSRNSYQEFSIHFPLLAESLTKSLGDRNRKYLNSNSNSGSNSSLTRIPATVTKNVPVRSISAIDLHTASIRAIASTSRQKASSSGVSTTTLKTRIQTTSQSNDQRVGRTKSRISVSQPTSRSGSPSSELNYLCSSGSISRTTKQYKTPTTNQKMQRRNREAEIEQTSRLDSPPLWYSSKSSRGFDNCDESEASNISSEHSLDSHRSLLDSISRNRSPCGLYPYFHEPMLKDIGEIIADCENTHWNEKREGLQSLQQYLQKGNKLELRDLKRVMDVFTKNFNDPLIKVPSLFIDSLNEVILCHHEDLRYCLHLLLTRLFNELDTDMLESVYWKIMKTLDIVFESFPPELQLQSVLRFLADPTQTFSLRVKLAVLNYTVKLTSVVDPCKTFSSNTIDSCKDYNSMALEKMVSWTMANNLKIEPELKRVSRETFLALFNVHPSQVTRRFSTMPEELREAAVTICEDHCFSSENLNELKTYIEELSQCSAEDESHREKLIDKITSIVRSTSSDVIINNFKSLLLTICGLLIPTESTTVKVLSFTLLQTITERGTVTDLLKDISDLVITKIIALVNDSSENVVKAAEHCAISLATFLPAEPVIRVVVPLITSEDPPAKLIAIKMLSRSVECSNDATTAAEIDQIMNTLLAAYNSKDSHIRKAIVFCMVALYKQSEEMKVCLELYFNRLQPNQLKLVQLYIQKAEQGSS